MGWEGVGVLLIPLGPWVGCWWIHREIISPIPHPAVFCQPALHSIEMEPFHSSTILRTKLNNSINKSTQWKTGKVEKNLGYFLVSQLYYHQLIWLPTVHTRINKVITSKSHEKVIDKSMNCFLQTKNDFEWKKIVLLLQRCYKSSGLVTKKGKKETSGKNSNSVVFYF